MTCTAEPAGSYQSSDGHDLLHIYLREVGRVPLLTAEQERELARRIAEATSEEERLAARNELVTANLRLAVAAAKRYQGRGLDLSDLIQSANLALLEAANRFDSERGRFSTLATIWITKTIRGAIANQGRGIRIPLHMLQVIDKLLRTRRRLVQGCGHEAGTADIARRIGLPESKVVKILKIAQEPISLETPIGEGEDSPCLGDFIADKSGVSPHDAVTNTNLKEIIEQALGNLPPRTARALRLRFGIGDGCDRTLEETGRRIGASRNRCRQIVEKGLRTLERNRALRTFAEADSAPSHQPVTEV